MLKSILYAPMTSYSFSFFAADGGLVVPPLLWLVGTSFYALPDFSWQLVKKTTRASYSAQTYYYKLSYKLIAV